MPPDGGEQRNNFIGLVTSVEKPSIATAIVLFRADKEVKGETYIRRINLPN